MRTIKLFASLLAFAVITPIVVTTMLSIILSPFQTIARAAEPQAMFEVTDRALDGTEETAAQGDAAAAGDGSDDADCAAADCAQDPSIVDDVNGGWEPAFQDFTSSGHILYSDEGGSVFADEPSNGYYTSDQLRYQGVIADGDYQYTWYSQRVLPGGGLDIDGRHVSDEGYVVDAQERIVVASSDLAYGTEIDVPFGNGKAIVLDSGCDSGTLDIYTDF